MSVSTLFNENTLTALEQYALSQNKQQFLATLPQGLEKKILNALSLPYDLKLRDKLFEAGLPTMIVNEIVDRKLYEKIQNAKQISQVQDIINDLKKSHLPYMNQQKPVRARQNNSQVPQGQNKNQISSKLKQTAPQNFSEYVSKLIKQNEDSITQFENYAIRMIPQQQILGLSPQRIQFVISKTDLIATFNEQFVGKLFKAHYEKELARRNQQYLIPIQYYANLPTSHINRLKKQIPYMNTDPTFLTIWFSSNFEKRYPLITKNNSNLSFSEKEQKRKILLQVMAQIQKIDKCPSRASMIKEMQIQLLTLDLSLEDPDLKRFVKYLETMHQLIGIINVKWQEHLRNSGSILNTQKVLIRLPSSNLNMYNFIQQYVTALLSKHSPSEYHEIDKKLLEYIDENRYRRIKSKVLLAKGQEQTEKILSQAQKLAIRQTRELTICKNNKNSFKVEQDVIIKLKVKNVKKIKVKVYQLNLQKHYIQNMTQISQQMQLHFLDPTFQFEYQINNKNPFQEQIYDLNIKQISKKRGIYIVDFDGQGISSRAVIRKGAIFCLSRTTLAGTMLRFYDQNGKKVQHFKLWIEGQYVSVKQTYLIPFREQEVTKNIIAIVGDYAEMLSIKIRGQAYRLQVNSYYNKQSFIVGGKSKIILNPRLYIQTDDLEGQTPISLKLLKNIRINVEVTDFQGLKSIISFQNVAWSYQQDYVIQIPIQNYIKSVNISGSAEITKYNGKKEQLRFNQAVNIFDYSNGFRDYYLKKVNNDYILNVLGLDGQPLPGIILPISIQMKWVQSSSIHQLQTDANGQINLGPLKHVRMLTINDLAKQWNINGMQGTSQILNKMCFRQGQKIMIPLPPTNYKLDLSTDINLFLMNESSCVENINKYVKINNKLLQIQGLPAGSYSLSFLSLNFKAVIVVVSGKQWENPNQMYNDQKSTVYEFIRSSNHYLNLDDPVIEKEGQNKKISIKILKPEGVQISQSVKAHIFAYCFIPNQTAQNPITLIDKADARYEKFLPKNNTYLSNKKLSQEASYVLNRKNQKQFVGNNLQKPHILLNRIKVRDTVQKDQNMNAGSNFAAKNQKKAQNLLDSDFANFDRRYVNAEYGAVIQNPSEYNITSHNNFLKHSGLTIQNIKNGNLQFKLPNCYSFISVVLVSNNSCLKRNFNLNESQVKTKKMVHLGLSKEDKQNQAWSMSRQIYPIESGQSRKISRTSKWCGVSLYNIMQFAKTQGVQLEQWVQRWGTYSLQTKLEIYNKKACHQLNSYIKHQDEQFFKKVVEPFIKNKINKTFVDLCLLEDPACQKWASLEFFDQINYFEKILLIQYLAKKGKKNESLNLAKGLQSLEKTNKYSYTTFKQKFETMLNAEIQPQAPSQLFVQPMSYTTSTTSVAYGAGGGLFGAAGNMAPPPPPQAMMRMARMQMAESRAMPMAARAPVSNLSSSSAMFAMPQQQNMRFHQDVLMIDQNQLIENRNTYVQQFKQVQNTQQFTQVTYYEIKNPSQCNKNFIPRSKFWVDLAIFLASDKYKNVSQQAFTAQSIIYLTDKRSFTLAASFLPKNLNPEFEISSQAGHMLLTANKPFLLFVKEIKPIEFNPKSGLLINHRFIDNNDPHIYEQDGTVTEKQVDQFIKGKQYCLQTLVTNTTANNLQVQILIDIPEGAIPLQTKQYTIILSENIGAYSTQSFTRNFYFPHEGQFNIYPANACKGKAVIAKANPLPKIKVLAQRSTKKLETFLDVMEEGDIDDIVKYLQSKNVFDQNFFRPNEFLWMLKDKSKFEKIIHILKDKGFIHTQIWRFGFLHDNLKTIKQYLALTKAKNPHNQTENEPLKVFEYYPYYSSRAHKYTNENKSKIRNVQFKQTFYRFLFEQVAYFKGTQKPNFKLAAAYFLLLQDRIDQASKLIKSLSQQQKQRYRIQYDYLECFLDMYEGFPTFSKARKISAQYTEYPISNWKLLFNQIQATLRDYDSATYVEDEEKKVEFKTTVINEGSNLRISIPAGHRVQVLMYSINLQLLFSENPFKEVKLSSSIKPAKIIVFEAGQSKQQKLKRLEDLKDVIVQVFESGKSIFMRKVDSILWINPQLKVKVNEKRGSLQVFYQGKPISGSYCKVYSNGAKGVKFYRDGYTDITGTFKYALSELKQINKFSVLCVTDFGGVVNQISPPSNAGELKQI